MVWFLCLCSNAPACLLPVSYNILYFDLILRTKWTTQIEDNNHHALHQRECTLSSCAKIQLSLVLFRMFRRNIFVRLNSFFGNLAEDDFVGLHQLKDRSARHKVLLILRIARISASKNVASQTRGANGKDNKQHVRTVGYSRLFTLIDPYAPIPI